jgi:hypothetical protein
MRVKILDAPVRENIELFLEILRRSQHRAIPSEKIFPSWLNRATGQLLFEKAEGGPEWKPVDISYRYDPPSGEIVFLIEEREAPMKGFRCDDLTPFALNVLRGTMKKLHEISVNLRGPSNLETKMGVLFKLTVDVGASLEDRNVLIDAWHHVDRLGAETLLFNHPVGTYLFRKDPFSAILEQQLCSEHGCEIKCITLTFSQDGQKISDLTLVHDQRGWQCYNDDPSLCNLSYRELADLLELWKDLLKFPLSHSR